MNKLSFMKAVCLILTIYTLLLSVPTVTLAAEEMGGTDFESDESAVPTLADNVKVGSRLWELFFGEGGRTEETPTLVPGGEIFGMKIKSLKRALQKTRAMLNLPFTTDLRRLTVSLI